MSILDNNSPIEQISQAQLAADMLIDQAKIIYQQITRGFNSGSKIFWNNDHGISPQDIADKLGNNAKEVFELHYKLGQFIGSINPEAIAEGVAVVGNFTMNEDGTVTITTPEPIQEEEINNTSEIE